MRTSLAVLAAAALPACYLEEPDLGDGRAELRPFAGQATDGLVHPLAPIGGNRDLSCTFTGPSAGSQEIRVRWADYDRAARTAQWGVLYVFAGGAQADRRFRLSDPIVRTSDGASTGRTDWSLREEITGATCRLQALRLAGEPDRVVIDGCSTGYTLECRRKSALGKPPTCDGADCNFAAHGATYAAVYDNYHDSGRNPYGCPQTDPDHCDDLEQACEACGIDCLPGTSGEWRCQDAQACRQGYYLETSVVDAGLGCFDLLQSTCAGTAAYRKYHVQSRERRYRDHVECFVDHRTLSVLTRTDVLGAGPHDCWRAAGFCLPPKANLPPSCQFDRCE